MQLLPVQNFLLESFCFTEYLQFPQKNGINCFILLETGFKSFCDFYFFSWSELPYDPLPYGNRNSAPSVTDRLHPQP